MPAVGDQHRDPPSTVTGTANPFDEGPRRISEYTAREVATLQARLDKQLGPEYISSRSGPSGQKVHYLAAEKCINLANEVFGFNGWSSSIQNIQIDFVDESPTTGKISLGLSVIVRVTLRDGSYHEDIGYGHIENCKGKAAAFEKAKKEGTTDGLKRALRTFGNVLGNCIYDKEYLAKVTRLKVAPSKWDAENLHRHPDFAPTKKEPVQDKKMPDEVELPPRPIEYNNRKEATSHETLTFDGDAEFGSDVFDEADFVANTAGNPDEVVLDVDTPQPIQRPQARPQLPPAQQRPQGYQQRAAPSNPAMTTPSKPERQWNAGPAPTTHTAFNNNTNQNAMPQRGGLAGNPQGLNQANPLANNRSSQEFQRSNNIAAGIVKTEQSANSIGNQTGMNNDPNAPRNGPAEPAVGFYSARAVDILRDNPRASPMAPKFDPHAESPSIRKTAGIDHTKSVPVSKPMLFGTSQSPAGPGAGIAAGGNRNFINPSTDVHRRIGAPGGNTGGIASPVNKGFTTSSYRPLTRPAVDVNRNATNTITNNNLNNPSAATTNDPSLKRPPLNDVTNAPLPGALPGSGDIKRPRLSSEAPQQQQQQQQPPQH